MQLVKHLSIANKTKKTGTVQGICSTFKEKTNDVNDIALVSILNKFHIFCKLSHTLLFLDLPLLETNYHLDRFVFEKVRATTTTNFLTL